MLYINTCYTLALEPQIWVCICHSYLAGVTAFDSVLGKKKKKKKKNSPVNILKIYSLQC